MKKSSSRPVFLLLSLSLSPVASAAVYQWNGTTDSIWGTASNWSPTGTFFGQAITAGPAPTGGTFAHRLNVMNGALNPLVYDATLGTTVYANAGSGLRGLVMSSGTGAPSSLFTITGGKFSSLGSNGPDAIGNSTTSGTVSTLTVNGGELAGSGAGTILNFGGTANVTTFNVLSGTATMATLTVSNSTSGSGAVNLDGGTLAVNLLNKASTGVATFNFNGGKLQARQNTTNFMTGLNSANVMTGGAVIDTNTFTITMGQALLDGTGGGGLTKLGAGTLTANAAHTYTGTTTVSGGKLAVTAPLASGGINVGAGGTLRVKAGVVPWAPATADFSGPLELDLGTFNVANPLPLTPGNINLIAPVTLSVAGGSLAVGDITLMTYTSKTPGSADFSLGTLPPGAAGTLEDTGSAIILHLTSPSVQDLTWSTSGGTWQVSGGAVWNANSATYQEYGSFGDLVNFTDAAAGIVDVVGTVRPMQITINNTAAYAFAGTGSIEGTGSLVKNGTGIATFTTADSYTGTVTVNAGAVIQGAPNTANGAITVATNATYGLEGVTAGTGRTLTYTGPGVLTANTFFAGSAVQRGALQGVSGNSMWAGNVSFSGTNARIGVQDGATLNVTGNITESVPGSTLVIRAGTLGSDVTISGAANSWTGATEVFSGGGSIKAGVVNAFATGGVLRVGTTGITGTSVFDLNGYNQLVAGLTVVGGTSATVVNNGPAPAVLTLKPIFSAPSFPGIIADGSSQLSIVKEGANVQTFTGLNTYSGSTTISEGTLALTNATLADKSDIFIADAGTLALNFAGTDNVDELTIAGVAKAPGIWGSAESGAPNVDSHLTGTGTLTVGDAFKRWASAAGLTGDDALPGADADKDGVQNILEFVLGSSPTSGDLTSLPAVVPTTGALTIRFSRVDASEGVINLTVQVSDDLQTWSPALDIPITAVSDLTGTLPGGATVTVTENDGAADTVEVSLPNGAASRRYMRLRGVKP